MTRMLTILRDSGVWLLRQLPGLAARAYALALAGLTIWLTWIVMSYLVRGFFVSVPSPAQVADLPRKIDAEMLQAGTAFAGFDGTEHPRMPPAHYHRFDAWYQPDRFNDCTRSGCHGPLPHQKHKESRAFLNMHATSMHCSACHIETDQRPLQLTWYDLETGRSSSPPAILTAYRLLTEKVAATETTRDQLAASLRRAAEQAGGNQQLLMMAEHLDVARVEQAAYVELLAAARGVVRGHMRGEYGAKLTMQAPDAPKPGHADTAAAIAAFLKGDVPDSERDRLLERVHPTRASEPRTCRDCHTESDSAVDFAALGYPPVRVGELLRPLVIQAISHSMEGQAFHLPGFPVEVGDTPAEDDVPNP